jgi:hypothetical protein
MEVGNAKRGVRALRATDSLPSEPCNALLMRRAQTLWRENARDVILDKVGRQDETHVFGRIKNTHWESSLDCHCNTSTLDRWE